MHIPVIPAGLYIYDLTGAFKNTFQSASSMTAGQKYNPNMSEEVTPSTVGPPLCPGVQFYSSLLYLNWKVSWN